jgi:arylsulfatase A-like enzyme
MVRWPGHIAPGTVSSVPVVGTDLFTTFCAIVGLPLPSDRTIDGADIRPAFEGRPVERKKPLYWRTHNAPPVCRVALRIEDWKIVANDDLSRFELYNLAADPHETTDLAGREPAKFAAMKGALLAMDAEVVAEGPDWWKHETPAQRAR